MDRKQAEQAFHDQRELERKSMTNEEWLAKYPNKRWYVVTNSSRRYVSDWIEANAPGKVALDFGCGLGDVSLALAKAGARVYAIDISPESVAATKACLDAAGLGDRLTAQVMDAENTEFEDSFFDLVVCSGVLHHMDVTKAFPELARVLKPTGAILAGEPLAYNPAINLYRKLTPQLRTEWEAEHILSTREFREARKSFGKMNIRYFHLLTIGAALFQRTFLFAPLLGITRALDKILLSIPGLRLLAWQAIFILSEPKKAR